jgi:hypothetical protein
MINIVSKSAVNPAPVTYTHKYGTIESESPQSRFYGDGSLKGFQTIPNIARGVLEYTATVPASPYDPKISEGIPGVQGGVASVLSGTTTSNTSTKKVNIVTSINFSNKHQHHLCEPVGIPQPKRTTITTVDGIEVPNLQLGAPALELSIILKSAEVQAELKKIRSAIEGALGDTFSTPLVTQFREAAAYIASVIKEINRIIKIYIINALLIVQVERYISLLIKFITSLPAIFAQALAECLTALRNALASALSVVIPNVGTGGLFGQIQALQRNIAVAENATRQVIAGAEQIVTDIGNIPKGIDAAVDILTSTLSNIQSNPPKPVVNVSFY